MRLSTLRKKLIHAESVELRKGNFKEANRLQSLYNRLIILDKKKR